MFNNQDRNSKNCSRKCSKSFDILKTESLTNLLFQHNARMLDLEKFLQEIDSNNDCFTDVKAYSTDNSNHISFLMDKACDKRKHSSFNQINFLSSELKNCCTYKNEFEKSYVVNMLNSLLPNDYGDNNSGKSDKLDLYFENEKLKVIVIAFKKILETYFISKYRLYKYNSAEAQNATDCFSSIKKVYERLFTQLNELSNNLSTNSKSKIQKDDSFSSINLYKTNKECKTTTNLSAASKLTSFSCASQSKKVSKHSIKGDVFKCPVKESEKESKAALNSCLSQTENSLTDFVDIDIKKLKEAIKEHNKFSRNYKNSNRISLRKEDCTDVLDSKMFAPSQDYLKQKKKKSVKSQTDKCFLKKIDNLSTKKKFSIHLNEFYRKIKGRKNTEKKIKENCIVEQIIKIDRNKLKEEIKASLKARKQKLINE